MSTPAGRWVPYDWGHPRDPERPAEHERRDPQTYPVPAPGPRDEGPPPAAWDDPVSWAPTVPSGPPSIVAVTDAAAAVVDDVATGVRGPALVGHALTFLIDAAMVAGLVPAWLDLPATLAATVSIGGALLSVGGHAYAVYQTIAKARAHQATVTAPTVALGRHQQR